MDRAEFEAGLRRDGYAEIVERRMEPNTDNPEHAHEFDARLMVIEGEMAIARNGAVETYRAGETFSVESGCRHAERGGSEGAVYLAGRRYSKPAA